MRIYERLRGRSRSDSAIERKLFEAITGGLRRNLEDGTSPPVLARSEAPLLFLLLGRRKGGSVARLAQINFGLLVRWQRHR